MKHSSESISMLIFLGNQHMHILPGPWHWVERNRALCDIKNILKIIIIPKILLTEAENMPWNMGFSNTRHYVVQICISKSDGSYIPASISVVFQCHTNTVLRTRPSTRMHFPQLTQDFLFSPLRAPASPLAIAVRAARLGLDPERFCLLFCLDRLAVPAAFVTRFGLTRTP